LDLSLTNMHVISAFNVVDGAAAGDARGAMWVAEGGFRVKLIDYARIRDDVLEFCRFYAKFLGNPLMERLRAEIYELLEEAIAWWEEQYALMWEEGDVDG